MAAVVVLVIVILGALLYTIFSRVEANGCFTKVCRAITWVVGIAITLAAPAVMVPILAILAFVWLIIWTLQKRKENHEYWVPPPIKTAKQPAHPPATQTASTPSRAKQTPLQVALVGATGKAQRFMPRDHAVTVMPGATLTSEFWSTHVRDAKGSRYVIVEPKSNQFIVLSSAEFVKDWVPWMEPMKQKSQPPTSPQWRSVND